MNLTNVARPIRAHEGVGLHYCSTEMPELARYALLSATTSLLIGDVGIIELPPKPAARTGKDARGMRPQLRARKQIAVALAIVGHSDGNIDPCPVERAG